MRSSAVSTVTATAPSRGRRSRPASAVAVPGSCRLSRGRPSGRWCGTVVCEDAAATARSPRSHARSARGRAPARRAAAGHRHPRRHRRRPADPDARSRPRRRSGRAPGDLYVLVSVREDERFVREGDDLITALEVPAPLAALGASLEVPTLDGTTTVELAPGTQPGEILTLRGLGMPGLLGRGQGSLRVVVNVVIPRRLSAEQRELLEQLERHPDRGEPALPGRHVRQAPPRPG